MQKLTITYLFLLVGLVFFSCEREYNNPYDRECPPEIWTPENLIADKSANGVLLTWKQTVKHFDGFLIDRSSDSTSWKNISSKAIDKETREYSDTTVSAGDTLFYRISAIADKNTSNYCYSNRVLIPVSLSSVITNDVTDITSTTATFNGNVISDGGATVTERGFCYATTPMPDITKNKATSGTGIGTFSVAITGLQSGTTYYVRAYATNSKGTVYGDQKTFTINTTLASVITNDVTKITSTTATFSGEVISDGGATVTERGFCYATTSYPDVNDTKETSDSGTVSFTKAITGLTGGTAYYVRAYAINSAGTTYGVQKTFTTTATCLCDESKYSSITDSRDGHEYKTMVIGTQTWMAENLAYLPKVNVVSQSSTTVAYYYVYDYYGTSVDAAKASSYYTTNGVLYNTSAARNSCPAGWHLPFDNEWVQLINYLVDNGYGYNRGSDIAKALASGNGWDYNSILGTVGNHQEENNLSCFTGLPVGVANGSFYDSGGASHWRSYNSGAFHIFSSSTTLTPCGYGSTVGLPVRCIKGEVTAYPPTVVTNDATNIGSSGATFNGSVTDAGTLSVTERGFCYGLEEAPDINENKVTSGSGTGNFSASVTGLLADTLYNVRAYAISDIGISYGEQVEFHTSENIGYCGCENSKFGSFTDPRDGHVYKTIQIGTQTWMAENLAYLPSVNKKSDYSSSSARYYVFEYDGTNVSLAIENTNYKTYGVLYNWPAALNACPAGWHLPSDAEWTKLSNYLGGEEVSGGKMKSTTGWKSPNAGATNESCFSALPGGRYRYSYGFTSFSDYGFWWCSTADGEALAWNHSLCYSDTWLFRYNFYKNYGFSVRCVKN